MKHLQETQISRVHSKVGISYLVKVNEVVQGLTIHMCILLHSVKSEM